MIMKSTRRVLSHSLVRTLIRSHRSLICAPLRSFVRSHRHRRRRHRRRHRHRRRRRRRFREIDFVNIVGSLDRQQRIWRKSLTDAMLNEEVEEALIVSILVLNRPQWLMIERSLVFGSFQEGVPDLRTDRRTDGPTDRRTDGRTDGQTLL